MTNGYKTGIYIRLSNEDGDKQESNSIGNQRSFINDYISSKEDLIKYEEYVDDGYTGTNFERPSFKKMLSDIENKNINCVIVKDLSRLGRDYIMSGYYIENFFVNHNVRFIAINDNLDTINNKNNNNSLEVPIKNVINDYYSQDISKKVRAAFDSKRKEGKFIGAFASYGYIKDQNNNNQLLIDIEASEVVKKIFQLYNEGNTQQGIARKLNELSISSPTIYKQKNNPKYMNAKKLQSTNYWTYSTIRRILKNQMYTGDMVQKKYEKISYKIQKHRTVDKSDYIIVKNTHEPIIDRELFNQTQELLAKHSKPLKNLNKVSMLSGYITCGDCGRKMGTRNCDKKNRYYICSTYRNSGINYCTSHSIRQDDLEDIVLTQFKIAMGEMFDVRKVKEVKSVDNNIIETSIKDLSSQLEKTLKLKKGIYEDWKMGDITKEEYNEYKVGYAEKEIELRNKLEALQLEISKSDNSVSSKNEWVKKLKKYKRIDKLDRTVVIDVLDSIEIYDDKSIYITWKFSNLLS